ncbi:hypothetical protein ALC62_10558 [Cyphomyrmex costatus]|uniref:Mos1 transposase HTH domain-containing protein n=1 Tax=Cyphomyrmex costatus TaxID=456900 RepID=A0A195CCZ4_9HYME|nr:hypothetical protein ALC62_10558 [Cyphomyrmex costatus]
MELNLQQRVCIKFCARNGFNGAEILKMLGNCFGSDALKKTTVYEWHERFRSGRESVEDDERNGKIEDDSDGYTDNRVPEIFRELDQALA